MYDVQLVLKDAGLVASSAAATVGGEAHVLNVGTGMIEGDLIIGINEIEIADNDELYTIRLQGSEKSDFADTIQDLFVMEFGAAEVLAGDQDSKAGKYIFPIQNKHGKTIFPYLRIYTDVAGTVGMGINFAAWIED